MSDHLFVGPPDRPDKYRLVRLEGSGGEASLWRAQVEVAGESETVAVKALRPEHHDDLARISARWAEQAELLRFVTHPCVVGVREHFQGDPPHRAGAEAVGGELYLVMNWVSGTVLRDWTLLRPGPEGTLAGLRVLEQVADALEMLHSGRATSSGRSLIHGDLSPGNVVVTDEGRAVLVDFGLVRLASHRTAAPAGTPGFAAPEVWSHGEYTPAADRYSFAALGFFMLLGTPPPADETQLADQLFGHPFLANTPPAQAERILAGLSSDPSLRPGAGEWLRLLRGAASTSARAFGPVDAPRTRRSTPLKATLREDEHSARRPRPDRKTRVLPGPETVAAADDVEAQLGECREGPGALVRMAISSGQWEVLRSWWARGIGGRTYHVKLRERFGGDWVVVEMLLRDHHSELVWASGAGGGMTECPGELADWLVPV